MRKRVITSPNIPKQTQELEFSQRQRSKFGPIEAAPIPTNRGDGERDKGGNAGAGKNRFLSLFGYNILKTLLNAPYRGETYLINGKSFSCMRMELPIEIDDLIDWARGQTLYPKIYWEDERDGTIFGMGKVLVSQELPTFDGGKGPRFFGGSDFMERKGKTWGEFPSSYYFIPLIEVEKRGDGHVLILNRTEETPDISLGVEASTVWEGTVMSRFDSPSYPVWEREVKEILRKISEGLLTKVVLARLTHLELNEKICPYTLLKKLSGPTKFAFQLNEKQTFIGNSPEMLYRRGGGSLESAAIAGTRPRGKTEEEDADLMDELLNCPKEQHEFQVVKEAILSSLSPLCNEQTAFDHRVLQTPKVQHLHHSIHGKLAQEVTDSALIEALSPTPAVGGFPKREALKELKMREQFDRGWYGAPVGWLSPHSAHFRVGIRSALIEEKTLRLFAGTGIVKGSIPLKEWEELEYKISQFMALL